jgi:hypothetical protein
MKRQKAEEICVIRSRDFYWSPDIIYYDDEIRESEMGKACNTHGKLKMRTKL